MNRLLFTAVLSTIALSIDGRPVRAQEPAESPSAAMTQLDPARERYRGTLLALRDTVAAVSVRASRFRRQLPTAGPETLLGWAAGLNGACRSAVAAFDDAEPKLRVRGADRVGVASRSLVETIDRARTVLRVECLSGLAPEGPGEWADTLRAWAPHRLGKIERQLVEYQREASRFAKAAGFKLKSGANR